MVIGTTRLILNSVSRHDTWALTAVAPIRRSRRIEIAPRVEEKPPRRIQKPTAAATETRIERFGTVPGRRITEVRRENRSGCPGAAIVGTIAPTSQGEALAAETSSVQVTASQKGHSEAPAAETSPVQATVSQKRQLAVPETASIRLKKQSNPGTRRGNLG
jgi:hypothetical protein